MASPSSMISSSNMDRLKALSQATMLEPNVILAQALLRWAADREIFSVQTEDITAPLLSTARSPE
eukprot:scaffold83770_cov48-Prasinocladus_malaysianus.AAC.1